MSRGVGMARLKNGNWDKIWTGNRTIKLLNGVVTLHNAYAIWMPFSPLNNVSLFLVTLINLFLVTQLH